MRLSGLLLLACLLGGVLSRDTNLYFEEGVVVIHSHISLNGVTEGLCEVKKSIKTLSDIQLESDVLSKLDSDLSEFWLQFRNSAVNRLLGKTEQLEKRIQRIMGREMTRGCGHVGKEKRAINFLGNLISYVTGVPGPDDWHKNVQNVDELKKAILLMSTQGDLRDHRIDIDEHEMGKIKNIIGSMVDKLVQLNTGNDLLLEGIRSRLKFWTHKNHILSTLDTIELFVHGLENVVTEGSNYRVAREGMAEKFLINQLQKIEAENKMLSPIFGSNEWEEYFNHQLATVARHGEAIWLSLRVPLVNFNKGLHENLNTAPMIKQINLLEKLGVTNPHWFKTKDDAYCFIGLKKLSGCIRLNLIRLCEGRFVLLSSSPKSRLIELKEIWSETDRPGYFAYISNTNISGMVKCGSVLRDVLLGKVGVVYLESGCELITNGGKIMNPSSTVGGTTFEKEVFRIIDDEYSGHIGLINQQNGMNKITSELREFTNLTSEHINLTRKSLEISRKLNQTLNLIGWDDTGKTKWTIGLASIGCFGLVAMGLSFSILLYKCCHKSQSQSNSGRERNHNVQSSIDDLTPTLRDKTGSANDGRVF